VRGEGGAVMAYQPRPGTIPFRAIAWLQKQGSDADVRLAPWAEALDVDVQTLLISLEAPIKHGLVVKFTRPGTQRPIMYRLGAGKSDRTPTVDDEDHAHARPAPSHSEVLELARNGHGAPLPSAVVAELSKPVQRAIANGIDVEHALEQNRAPMFQKPDGVDIDRANRKAEAITLESAPSEVARTLADTAHIRARWADDARRATQAPSAPLFCSSAAAPRSAYEQQDEPSDDFKAARWHDDSLSIEVGGTALKLTRAQALRIVALYGVPS
jgi:hypothetical protein